MTLTNAQFELGRFGESAPPEIAILSPVEGAVLGDTTLISLAVVDGGTAPSDQMFNVAYSPNGGGSWVPLAVNVPGTKTELEVDTREISRSEGNGIIRVFVSDDLNTVGFYEDVPALWAFFQPFFTRCV